MAGHAMQTAKAEEVEPTPEEVVKRLTEQADRIARIHPRLSLKALRQLILSAFSTSRAERIPL